MSCMTLIYIAVFAVCFFSLVIGAICGIGGGVTIKPVLDALGFPGFNHQLPVGPHRAVHDDLLGVALAHLWCLAD